MTAALNVHEQDLGELIGNFNTFFHNFAVQASSLTATVALLPSTLHNANQRVYLARRGLPADADVRAGHHPGGQADARDDQRGAAVD